jgi:hypothetical protein
MLTPMPMSPEAAPRTCSARRVEPQNFSGCAGPGTLVITAVAFLANRPSIAFCTGLMNSPATASTAEGQQRLEAALELLHARRTA